MVGWGTGGACTCTLVHDTRVAALVIIQPVLNLQEKRSMVLLLLEALLALALLVFIVWWTMFSGRPKGEPPKQDDSKD
jgi:hypothetical protein